MYSMGVKTLLEERKCRGSVVELGNLSREYEVTRYAYMYRENTLVFRVNNSEVVCYSNLISSRRDLYSFLNAKNDKEAYTKLLNSIKKPRRLDTMPFSEYFERVDFSLLDIPFIKYFREDGGYYLTGSIVIACIEEFCNASFHRMMYVDQDKAAIRIVPRHLYFIYSKYRAMGRDLPVAVVLGVDPAVEIAAASSAPLGVFELEVAAAISGDDKVVKTPLYNIPVPAHSSIVLEGVISHDEFVDEGPFTDIIGLLDEKRRQPVFKLEAVYANVDGLFYHAIVPSFPEHVYLMGFPREAQIYDFVKNIAPTVRSVRLTPGSGGWLHAVISMKQHKPGEARSIGIAVINAHPSVKHVIVVDEDIDVDNPLMIEWALATRVKGSEDIIVLKGLRGSTLDPRSSDGYGDKVIVDATKPFDEPWTKYRRVRIP